MEKIKLDKEALAKIRDYAIKTFHERKSFAGMSGAEIQHYTILSGLYQFLKTNGIEPPFEMEPEPEDKDFESIEDL